MPEGGTDDRYELSVSVENDGAQVATDFQLDVEIPSEFLDDGGHRLLGRSITPGFARFTIDHRDEIVRKEHFYPRTRTQPLNVSLCGERSDQEATPRGLGEKSDRYCVLWKHETQKDNPDYR